MKKVFMIFVKEEVAQGNYEAYTSKKVSTPEAAHDYIKNVLEVEDKKQGIYEPDYYTVEDMTKYFQK